MKYLKVVLFIINFIIWLSGGIVMFIGSWLFLEPSKGYLLNLFISDLLPHKTIHIIAYSLLGLGFVVITISFFGCRVAVRESQCILATYISIVIVLIILELITAVILGLMTFRVLSGLETRFTNKLAEGYGHDPTSDTTFSQSLDFAQYKLNCCGINSDADYNGTAWWRDSQITGKRRQVPLTCCVLKDIEIKNTGSPMSVISRVFYRTDNEKPWIRPQPKDEAACQVQDKEGHEGYRHKEGCLDKITSWLQCESYTLIFIALSMAGIQSIGIVTSILLYRKK